MQSEVSETSLDTSASDSSAFDEEGLLFGDSKLVMVYQSL